MKKFIMTSPFQPKGRLEKGIYQAADNQKLSYDKPTSFPIIPVIHGYAEPEEQIEVLVILSDYENAEYNLSLFQEELKTLCTEKNIRYTLKILKIPYDNTLDTQLALFQKLIDCTADNDTLYACMTYGTKPMPMVITMGLNYAHRVHQNVSIDCIVYGAKDFNTNTMQIYDITSLLYMDEIVRLMAEQKTPDPAGKIKKMLALEDEENDT